MRALFRKIAVFIIVFSFILMPVYSKNSLKIHAGATTDFNMQEIPKELNFITIKSRSFSEDVTIPENSSITVEVIKVQKELRWHKSGYILCKLKNYTPDGISTPIDVSEKDIYLVIRKYEEVDGKEATLIGLELVVMQGASFFAPGADIGYYFIKGAIQKDKDRNWWKAGVHNAYENSICWFWLKGKPITMQEDDQVIIKGIEEKKAQKLSAKIDKRNLKEAKKIAKKELKQQRKNEKQELKLAKKELKQQRRIKKQELKLAKKEAKKEAKL